MVAKATRPCLKKYVIIYGKDVGTTNILRYNLDIVNYLVVRVIHNIIMLLYNFLNGNGGKPAEHAMTCGSYKRCLSAHFLILGANFDESSNGDIQVFYRLVYLVKRAFYFKK